MSATFNRSDRECFAALQTLGRVTVAAILSSGRMTTKSNITVMKALRDLVAAGLARRIKAERKHTPGHWELLPGAVMPPGSVRTPPTVVEPLAERVVLHGNPPPFVAALDLRGMVQQQIGGK